MNERRRPELAAPPHAAPGQAPPRAAATGHPNTGLAIEATGLAKSYQDVRVLSGVDIGVPAGTVFALLGPNGAGKPVTDLRHSLPLIAANEHCPLGA